MMMPSCVQAGSPQTSYQKEPLRGGGVPPVQQVEVCKTAAKQRIADRLMKLLEVLRNMERAKQMATDRVNQRMQELANMQQE
jgi:hypothetical protein